MSKKEKVRIQLTDEQKRQIRQSTGKEASAIELSVEELEDRVSPGLAKPPSPGGK